MRNLNILIFMFITSLIYSQGAMIVSDVTANQTLASQLTSSGKQLAQLEKSYKLLKDAEKKFQKVNSIVTSVYKVKDIIDLQTEAIENIKLVLKNTNLKGKKRERLVKTLTNNLVSITRRVSIVTDVLQDGFFDMTDKERIDMFDKERRAVFTLMAKTRGYANAYKKKD